ncbi:MAG: hypothetical protein AAB550_02585 [Patescibacteria group bacterium]
MNKPYIRELEEVDGFKVWEVDGKYIRDNTDREFTNFGQHFRFPFIPKHEFWIDHEAHPGETKFFIDHMIIEWQLMDQGKKYDYAIGVADKKELAERKKFRADPKKLYIKKLEERGEVTVWLVDGELVRDLYYIEFTEGGHHYVYDFVPKYEVWLDDDLETAELPYVLLHELHERNLMHTGLTYNHAHHSSSIIEYKCRRDPSKLEEYIKFEVLKSSDSKVGK